MMDNSSPLGSPVGGDRPGHQRAKSSSFSLRSQKSDKSTSKPKLDLTETEREKRASKFSGVTHVNPNKAINEAQPSVIAQEKATLTSLRSLQHKDWRGNAITDPDSSNPARSRMERPLDTIRSFEAAIEGGRQRRTQLVRAETADALMDGSSRRSSVIGDLNGPSRTPSAWGMQPSRRPMWQRDPYQQRDYHDGPSRPPNSYRRGPPPRMSSAPIFSPRQQYSQESYQHHGYHESYDTTESGGSHSDPWGNSTDPSSENSSVDRIHAAREGDAYGGYGGYGGGSPNLEQNYKRRSIHGLDFNGPSYQSPGQHTLPDRGLYGQGPTPPPNDRRIAGQRQPISLVPEADVALPNGPGEYGQPSGVRHHKNYSSPMPGQMNGRPLPSEGQRPWVPSNPNAGRIPNDMPQRNATLRKKQPQVEPKKEEKKSWLRRTFSRSK